MRTSTAVSTKDLLLERAEEIGDFKEFDKQKEDEESNEGEKEKKAELDPEK